MIFYKLNLAKVHMFFPKKRVKKCKIFHAHKITNLLDAYNRENVP